MSDPGIGIAANRFPHTQQDGGVLGSPADVVQCCQQALPLDSMELCARQVGAQELFFGGVNQVAKGLDINRPDALSEVLRLAQLQAASACDTQQQQQH